MLISDWVFNGKPAHGIMGSVWSTQFIWSASLDCWSAPLNGNAYSKCAQEADEEPLLK